MTLLYRITGSREIERLFPNAFFSSKRAMQQNDIKMDRVVNSIVLLCTNETVVSKIFKLMQNKKSGGHDGSRNEVLKSCSPVIDALIATISNRCLQEEFYLKTLKKAKIVPIQKKCDSFQPQKYTSTSFLNSAREVFQKFMQKQLINFCEKNNILTINQFG